MTHCVGAILAGGGATRFGGEPKGLRVVEGARIIDRVAAALREVSDELLLVANDPGAAAWLPGVRTVGDARTGQGALGGLHAALKHAHGSSVLVVAWDMPFVSAGLLRALRALGEAGAGAAGAGAAGAGAAGADAAVADAAVAESESSGRGVEPLCAWYGPSCLAAIERRLDAGDRRVVGFFDDVHVARLPAAEVSQHGESAHIFFNVNFPGDLPNASPP